MGFTFTSGLGDDMKNPYISNLLCIEHFQQISRGNMIALSMEILPNIGAPCLYICGEGDINNTSLFNRLHCLQAEK